MLSLSVVAQRKMEYLDRGLVAVKVTGGVFLSWRILGTDPSGIGFNIYRGTTKVNATPITGASNLTDVAGTATSTYTVAPVIGNVEQAVGGSCSVWASQGLTVQLQQPAAGTNASGAYTYSPNDCSVGDVDGDGQWEIIAKWDPSNSKDNSQSGYTGNVFLDCYEMDGTRLWRIDLGVNIRAGAHYTQFQVGDFNVDGKAELVCKTAPGTKDGTGKYLSMGNAASDDDSKDFRNSGGYVLSGNEYLTVFNGQTGKEMATIDFNPARGTVSSWGDSYGNRVDRFLGMNAYLDGVKPSIVYCRGYYTRMAVTAWDWDGTTLKQRWYYNGATKGAGGYGQGNHNWTCGDVDGDGKDEIIHGSCAIDDNGALMYRTGLGHGDAIHMSDLDPDNAGLEVWEVHEETSSAYGYELHDAKTGKILWGTKTGTDNGRGNAGDVDPNSYGSEMWSAASGNTFSCKGVAVQTSRPSYNFRIYWDGDLQDELLDGNKLDKWNSPGNTRMITFTGNSCNTTKATPNLSADIIGDWREEVILHDGASKLYIYTTTIPTTNRMYTLMHDPNYRNAISWQNTAYNQPPHLGFWLGKGVASIPTPNIVLVGTNTNKSPLINILTPATGATFNAPASLSLTATASDPDGTVARVDYYNGTTLIGSATASPYTFAWANLAAGTYSITAKATDNKGATTTSTAITVKVLTPQAPYSGTAKPIPGTIQFEEYDLGGNGYAYLDNSAGSAVTPVVNYRTTEDVDVENCGDVGGGYNVGYATAGEWLEYTVNVAAAGTYNVELRVACAADGRTLTLEMGGKALATNLAIPNTGAWQTYQTLKIDNVTLAAGVQIMKVTMGALDYVNMNYITFASPVVNKAPTVSISSPITGTKTAAPAEITIDATATDDGTIAKVEFFNGNVKLGEDNSAPYSYVWSNVAAGTYSITAVATDNQGATTISTAVQVTVQGPDCAGVIGGEATLDNCGICSGGTTGITACVPTKVQAEDISCDYPGIIESKNLGFEGVGYLNVDNDSNTTASFTIISPKATTLTVGIQYANGATVDRPCRILVNDVEQVASLSMPITTAWTTYKSVETTLKLNAGVNRITLVSLSVNGFANLDYYYLYGDAQFGNCQIRQQTVDLQKGWNLISVNVRPTDSTIATLFKGLDVLEVKNMDAFWRADQPDMFNLLQTITPGQGYLVNMNTEGTLILLGTTINEQYKLANKKGWQMLGCPYQAATGFSFDFDALNCIQIKDFGGFWAPDGTANSLQSAEPGKAYYIQIP